MQDLASLPWAAAAAFWSFFCAASSMSLAVMAYSLHSFSQEAFSPLGGSFLTRASASVANSFVSFWMSSHFGGSALRAVPSTGQRDLGPLFSLVMMSLILGAFSFWASAAPTTARAVSRPNPINTRFITVLSKCNGTVFPHETGAWEPIVWTEKERQLFDALLAVPG